MKRLKIFLIILFMFISMCSPFYKSVYALSFEPDIESEPVEDNWIKGSLIVNGCQITNDSTVIINERTNNFFISLRTALEALGADVEWDNDLKEVHIYYNGKEYLGTFWVTKEPGKIGRDFYIRDTSIPLYNERDYKKAESLGLSVDIFLGRGYIYLSPTRVVGSIEFTGDRIYLYKYSMERFLAYIGFSVRYDYEAKTVEIFESTQENEVDVKVHTT